MELNKKSKKKRQVNKIGKRKGESRPISGVRKRGPMAILLDFVKVRKSNRKEKGKNVLSPTFDNLENEDLLARGGKFYAAWDGENETWTGSIRRVTELVDRIVMDASEDEPEPVGVRLMRYSADRVMDDFINYCKHTETKDALLDQKITFLSDRRVKGDFCSKRLPYDLSTSEPTNYIKLTSTLYDEKEIQKFNWFMGSIIDGDFPNVQKFLAITGAPGTGKSTLLNIVEMCLGPYCVPISCKKLTSRDNRFALSQFKSAPLIALDHDGDLSRVVDNATFNNIISHEITTIERKGVDEYSQRIDTMLLLASNTDVNITDTNSGLIRRTLDMSPSGRTLPYSEYEACVNGMNFEKGAICNLWLKTYRDLGRSYYNSYVPYRMISNTNDFVNFVNDEFDRLSNDGYAISLKDAYTWYKEWCEESGVLTILKKSVFKKEMRSIYCRTFENVNVPSVFVRPDSSRPRGVAFQGLDVSKLIETYTDETVSDDTPFYPDWLSFDNDESILDDILADCKAQYSSEKGTPRFAWKSCHTTLSQINTKREHWVRPPSNMVVIDLDMTDEHGAKSEELNKREASKWPETYAEFSKSGKGIHLHYWYDGPVDRLVRCLPDNSKAEIKTFGSTTRSSLRRKLTRCNSVPVAKIEELPLEERKRKSNVIDEHEFKSEKQLRRHIERNLMKEFGATKPSIDFINNALNKAYDSGLAYDVSDMRPDIWNLACSSTHQANYCMDLVGKMRFASEKEHVYVNAEADKIVFFDIEIFPNLFVVCYKFEDNDHVFTLVNPNSEQIEELCRYKLVGFNNRHYDNHILYAAMLGRSVEEIYELSHKIINYHGDGPNPSIGKAYNLSYADIYEFSSVKQTLKKFEIDLGIHHQECPFPWDEPVSPSKWGVVCEYCQNDVRATEAVFKSRYEDFVAREIIANISGLSVNHTARQHATRIIFGDNKEPQSEFVYTDLSDLFPGYSFDSGVSTYMGEVVGEGGYVYAEEGMYDDVTVLDVASMHPSSIIALNLFGDRYTARFKELVDLRLAIKHKDYARARTMLDGKVAEFLTDEDSSDALATALKLVINSIYGYTCARFDCEFRDPRNVDNIVAKRGALFMVNLKHEVQERGFTVAHIKTDSIKIPNATQEIIDFVCDYGKRYGYTFEIENEFERFCLVNDAVYVAKHKGGGWDATGKQFQVPYVFKTLFSKQELDMDDFCVTKSVKNASIYLDENEGYEEGEHNYVFVGGIGSFVPMLEGVGAGVLLRKANGTEKYSALAETKGYRWLDREVVESLELQDSIDIGYFERLAEEAVKTIEKYGDFSNFVKE